MWAMRMNRITTSAGSGYVCSAFYTSHYRAVLRSDFQVPGYLTAACLAVAAVETAACLAVVAADPAACLDLAAIQDLAAGLDSI